MHNTGLEWEVRCEIMSNVIVKENESLGTALSQI